MQFSITYAAPTLAEFIAALDALKERGFSAAPVIAPPAPPQERPAPAAPVAKGAPKHPLELAYNSDSFRPDGTQYRTGKKFTTSGADCAGVGWTGEGKESGNIPPELRLAAIVRRLVSEGMPAGEIQAIMQAAPPVPDTDADAPPVPEVSLSDIDESDL